MAKLLIQQSVAVGRGYTCSFTQMDHTSSIHKMEATAGSHNRRTCRHYKLTDPHTQLERSICIRRFYRQRLTASSNDQGVDSGAIELVGVMSTKTSFEERTNRPCIARRCLLFRPLPDCLEIVIMPIRS
jgi:hypothetical protein